MNKAKIDQKYYIKKAIIPVQVIKMSEPATNNADQQHQPQPDSVPSEEEMKNLINAAQHRQAEHRQVLYGIGMTQLKMPNFEEKFPDQGKKLPELRQKHDQLQHELFTTIVSIDELIISIGQAVCDEASSQRPVDGTLYVPAISSVPPMRTEISPSQSEKMSYADATRAPTSTMETRKVKHAKMLTQKNSDSEGLMTSTMYKKGTEQSLLETVLYKTTCEKCEKMSRSIGTGDVPKLEKWAGKEWITVDMRLPVKPDFDDSVGKEFLKNLGEHLLRFDSYNTERRQVMVNENTSYVYEDIDGTRFRHIVFEIKFPADSQTCLFYLQRRWPTVK